MHEMGIKTLIVTNAAGASIPPTGGDLMLIQDHIGLMAWQAAIRFGSQR